MFQWKQIVVSLAFIIIPGQLLVAQVFQEAESQPLPSTGVEQKNYTHASGGFVLQGYGVAGWSVTLKPGLTGRYAINVRTRAGWASGQSCFGNYFLSIDGQSLPMTRDESTKTWYTSNENYVWWKIADANGVMLTANSIGQITGDWVWGFVDAYEFVPVAGTMPIVREAEDTNFCSSGGAFQTQAKSNASGGRVYQQAGNPAIWPHYIKPGLSGWYKVEYRTRYGYDNHRWGDYSLKKDGVYLAAYYDSSTIEYFDGEVNYVWWKADEPVFLTVSDRLEVACDWVWGFVDAYRFTPCWNKPIEAEDTTYCSTAGVWQTRSYPQALGESVFQQIWSDALWPCYVSPNVSGDFIIRVRTRFNYQNDWRPCGAISIILNGQNIPLQYEIDTLKYHDDNENYIWWSTIVPVTLTVRDRLEVSSQWGWDFIDAYDFVRTAESSIEQIPGDANNDGMVDVGDLGILAANYGTASGATWSIGDFNGDGAVDVGDLGILAARYGEGVNAAVNFQADYAKAFGVTVSDDNASPDDATDEIDGSLCSGLGLPLIVGLFLMGLMLTKQEN